MKHINSYHRGLGWATSIILLFGFAVPAPADAAGLTQWSGTVTRIIDGDTFEVSLGGTTETIRIAGLNTNEVNHPADCWAEAAKVRLGQLIAGKTVTLKARSALSKANGRALRHVFLQGTNVAELMIGEGYGLALVFVDKEPDFADAYIRAFWEAHEKHIRIHDTTGCGAGPQQSASIELITIGDADGTDSSNINGEYVDIVNHGGSLLDLAGWSLHDSAIGYYDFPANASIRPNERIRVHVGTGTNTQEHLYMGFDSPIFSGMDGAFLLDPDEDIRAFDYWPCHGRCGEPAGELAIETVIYDVPGKDDDNPNGEQIVIRNTGPTTIDLTDWRLESFPHLLHFSAGSVGPTSEITVHVGQGTNAGSRFYWGKPLSILDNGGDVVLLRTPHGDIQSCFSWGSVNCSDSASLGGDKPDFDADGFADLLIGVPGEAIGSRSSSGAANLVWGRSIVSGSTAGDILLRQGNGFPGSAEEDDQFGSASTSGDFDGDGYADLVVGAPGEKVGSAASSGSISVLYGGRYGLNGRTPRLFSQWGSVPGAAEANDLFGSSLSAGDYNGDGRADLAIGVPGESIGSKQAAGSVVVLLGSANGLGTNGSQSFSQSGPIPGSAEADDRFGSALTSGDFNGDGYDDLAIGSPGEDLGTTKDAGTVTVIYGSPSGLELSSSESRSQSGSIPGSPEKGDLFGQALASGDTDGDGYDDLVVGVPGEDLGLLADAGMIVVINGTSAGVDSDGHAATQKGSVPGAPEQNDGFGTSIAVSDLNRDGFGDVVVGVPGEGLGGAMQAGLIIVLWSDQTGMNSSGSSILSSSDWGSPQIHNSRMGESLMNADFNGDGFGDVAIGRPGAVVSGFAAAGQILLILGSENGINPSSVWDQLALVGSPEAGDRFGASLITK